MAGEHQYHTSTVLPDGRVLAAGGEAAVYHSDEKFWTWDGVSRAELFDPIYDAWTPAPDMLEARDYHTATALTDGRVLVVGGVSGPCCAAPLASAEIYDPSANTWSAVAAPLAEHMGHTASLLADGRVLVVGGYGRTRFGPSEIYDPARDEWTIVPSPAEHWVYHDAVTLRDGRVLLTAGCLDDAKPSAIFAPATSSWTTVPMNERHCGGQTVLLGDGPVLVAGASPPRNSTSAEIFDPATSAWSSLAPMHVGRYNAALVVLDDRRVLVAGGGAEAPDDWRSAEIYDVVADTWTRVDDMSMRRIGAAASQLLDGRILVSGGYDTGRANSETFDGRSPTVLVARGFLTGLASFSAQLKRTDGEAVAERSVFFYADGRLYCSAVTDAKGAARCSPTPGQLDDLAAALTRTTSYRAYFKGDGAFAQAGADGSFVG
jgi:hypothetical protein